MVKFTVDKKTFKKFLEVCSMEGIIQFRDKKSIKKPLFSTFYMDVLPEGIIEVLTTDTYRKKTDALFTLSGVEVEESGKLPIMDYKAIVDCLGTGIKGKIRVENNGTIILIATDKDSYEIRQKSSKELEDLQADETVAHLNQWREWHVFDGEGDMLIMHHPKLDVPYPMKISVSKEDLMKVVGDTINIMKDNKTTLWYIDDGFNASKGEENASIRSKHAIGFELLLNETIEFAESFYNIQTIIPNLFDKIELNIRRVKANNTIAVFITSIEPKLKMETKIGLVSIIKQTGGEET